MKTAFRRNITALAFIPLFLAGCGEKVQQKTSSETPSPAPTPSAPAPDVLPDSLKVERLAKTYVITGIGLSGNTKVAIINNQVLKPGMEIDPGVVLKDVQSTYATILIGNTEHRIRPESIQNELDNKKR